MDLILWRHAEAFDQHDGINDLDRALTPKGERHAQHMATWLNRQLPAGTRMLVSPAQRTQQTAAALNRRKKTVAALAPDGTVDGLLAAVRWPEAREPVLVVGHQPTLGLTASYLLTGATTPWALRKGAILWLRVRQRQGQAQVILHAALGVDLL